MEPYKDYSNTGIYKRNTEHTNEINDRLKLMYDAFYRHMKDEAAKYPGFSAYGYNGVQLLTCFDSYIESKKKIMCFGKEAHTSAGRLFEKPTNYQSDEYYSYDYSIAHICDESSLIPKCDCRNTEYLKTRRIISGIGKNGEGADERKVLSILNNNLNKTSLGGNLTPCYSKNDLPKNEATDKWKNINNQIIRDKIVYSPFEFEGVERNIFQHELNILRPTHLIFLSGTGYINHIIRDFGKSFYEDKIKPLMMEISLDSPVSKSHSIITKDEIKDWFNIDEYDTGIEIIYAYHPSAHLSENARLVYNDALSEFARQPE